MTEILRHSWLLCPRCGSRMAVIEIDLPVPPFVVELAGCEACGITSNELRGSEAAPAPADPERS